MGGRISGDTSKEWNNSDNVFLGLSNDDDRMDHTADYNLKIVSSGGKEIEPHFTWQEYGISRIKYVFYKIFYKIY